ncbi:hypothetical protein EFP05_08445 [Lactiplantibacillus pentosus]|nr:hypothetical protein [Lactiplantibacillus pentosus]MCT3277191.1 hypothetical protein [Lactiplantibacillus pentosus]PRO92161.1 hypothetical protein C6Y13_02270 [Lactiplantibacillus pentosus]
MAWLVGDQYLRRGLRLKSVSTTFQRCQKYLEAGIGSNHHSKFTVIRTVSSGPKLAVLILGPRIHQSSHPCGIQKNRPHLQKMRTVDVS